MPNKNKAAHFEEDSFSDDEDFPFDEDEEFSDDDLKTTGASTSEEVKPKLSKHLMKLQETLGIVALLY